MKRHAVYRKAFEAADQSVQDMLEQEAIRRGVQGVERPVYQGGRMVGYVRDYSDPCLIFLMKCRILRYRGADANQILVDGKIDHHHEHEHNLKLDLTPGRLAEITRIFHESRIIDVTAVETVPPAGALEHEKRGGNGNGKELPK